MARQSNSLGEAAALLIPMLRLCGVNNKENKATEFPNTVYWTININLVTEIKHSNLPNLHELAAFPCHISQQLSLLELVTLESPL